MEKSITIIGTKIRVNKGQIETLIRREGVYGLFKSRRGLTVRNIARITDKEILFSPQNK